MFEEEYENIMNELQIKFGEDDYIRYLKGISAKVHMQVISQSIKK